MAANLEPSEGGAAPGSRPARNVPVPGEVAARREVDPQEILEDGGVNQEPDGAYVKVRTPGGESALVWMRWDLQEGRPSFEGRATAGGGTAALLLGSTAVVGANLTIWTTVSPGAAIITDAVLTLLFVLHRLLPDRRA